LITVLSGLPSFEVWGKAWHLARQVLQAWSYRGMYEVLEHETTLELKDRAGKRATFEKEKRVRYLQDNIIAYHDQAWGDGEILLDYRCTPGTPVDRYRLGYKTYILISRREVKNKGDVDTFHCEWGIRQGFLRKTEQWETHVQQPTKHLQINVIFPKSRPPLQAVLIESNGQRTQNLGKDAWARLPDGRWLVAWETRRPRLYENYVLQWQW
jgi:hypothetical protein